MSDLAPEICHNHLLDHAPRALAFDPESDFGTWRRALGVRLREQIGVMPARVEPDLWIEHRDEHPNFHETRFRFHSEAGADVPCHLLVPAQGKPPFPVVICLQGHSTGMHISLGRAKYEEDQRSIEGGRDFAIQAIGEGYAALVLEQRCFGERKDQSHDSKRGGCTHASMTALLLGRTMIGERVWDVSRAIDVLEAFPELDRGRIGCMGNSGGGTVTYYAACLEPRIAVAMPSCSVCTYRDSIGRIDHCVDNYIPGALRWFDMGDLAGLIAPRPLVMVAGEQDRIFPISGVRESFETVRRIYRAAGVPERCQLVVGSAGHQFYPEAWAIFRQVSGW